MLDDNKKGIIPVFTDGILAQNPVFIQLLGMCPTLAISTTLKNGIGMGIAATAVLLGSNIAISLLRKFIPEKIRIAAFVVVIASFVTAVDLLLKAYVPALSKSLGLFIPLIVVNCIILARAESFASKNNIYRSAVDGLGMGLGFTLALIILSIIREVIGSGTIYGYAIPNWHFSAILITLPPGGFLVLGCLIALVQKITDKKGDKV